MYKRRKNGLYEVILLIKIRNNENAKKQNFTIDKNEELDYNFDILKRVLNNKIMKR